MDQWKATASYRDALAQLNKYPRVQQMRPRTHFQLLNPFKHFQTLYEHLKTLFLTFLQKRDRYIELN